MLIVLITLVSLSYLIRIFTTHNAKFNKLLASYIIIATIIMPMTLHNYIN